MRRLQAKVISFLPVDRFSSPFIPSDSSQLLIEVDISPCETQTFLIDEISRILYVENHLWADQQLNIVQRALNYAELNNNCTRTLTRKTILLGVWHFGHFIGDHIHRLISHKTISDKEINRSIHLSTNQGFIQDLGCLFRFSHHQDISDWPPRPSRQRVRIYRLQECICFFPARSKAVPLSLAHCFLQKSGALSSDIENKFNVLLTSGRSERICNIKDIAKEMDGSGWVIVNPLVTPLQLVLKLVANAKQLVSENGSILFNCFIARSKPYFVLASSRCRDLDEKAETGGGVYNKYHRSVAHYVYCDPKKIKHHPYSDQINISDKLKTRLLGEP